jgi:hypothetical protein
MFPAVEHLHITSWLAHFNDAFSRQSLTSLTNLRSLAFRDVELDGFDLHLSVSTLTTLTALACFFDDPCDMTHLARAAHQPGRLVVFTHELFSAQGEPVVALDVSALLEGTTRLPKLKNLSIECSSSYGHENFRDYFALDTATLSKFVGGSPALRALTLKGRLTVTLSELELLSRHPALQRLAVVCGEGDAEEVGRLAAAVQQERGLKIDAVFDYRQQTDDMDLWFQEVWGDEAD